MDWDGGLYKKNFYIDTNKTKQNKIQKPNKPK